MHTSACSTIVVLCAMCILEACGFGNTTVPGRPVKCAPSFAGGTPVAGGEETSARSEDHSGANTHSLNPFKFLTPAVKSGEGGTTTTPRQTIPKIVARPAGKSAFGLASDFCTFALQQQMVGAIYLKSAEILHCSVTLSLC